MKVDSRILAQASGPVFYFVVAQSSEGSVRRQPLAEGCSIKRPCCYWLAFSPSRLLRRNRSRSRGQRTRLSGPSCRRCATSSSARPVTCSRRLVRKPQFHKCEVQLEQETQRALAICLYFDCQCGGYPPQAPTMGVPKECEANTENDDALIMRMDLSFDEIV